MNIFLLVLPLLILVWAIQRWWEKSPKIVEPEWRSYVAIWATGLVALSDLLLIVYSILAGMGRTGTCEYWICPLVALSGFFLAPFAFLASLFGKGLLRWPACGLSAFMTLMWLAAGLGA